jgi:hypothetical protein
MLLMAEGGVSAFNDTGNNRFVQMTGFFGIWRLGKRSVNPNSDYQSDPERSRIWVISFHNLQSQLTLTTAKRIKIR